jgi:hypothetical protein
LGSPEMAAQGEARRRNCFILWPMWIDISLGKSPGRALTVFIRMNELRLRYRAGGVPGE